MLELNGHRLLTVMETAQFLNIGRDASYKLFRQPDFPCVRIGKRQFADATGLDIWLKNKRETNLH